MVRSEPVMTEEDVNIFKGMTAMRLLGEGVEQLLEKGSLQYTEEIINQARQEAGLRGKDVCGHCTTHNAVPCKSGNGLCHHDKEGKCGFHDKSDPQKAFKICPKDICNRIVRIIKSRHRFHSPNFKNTDARKWFQNPFEIMKCFIPTDGYQDKETIEKTDCAGLLAVIINCKSFQSKVAADLGSPDNIFVKMREARNKMFHSAGFKITDRECQEYMQLMLSLLSDSMFLARDKDATTAAEKIQQVADSSVHVYCGEEVHNPGVYHSEEQLFMRQRTQELQGQRTQELQETSSELIKEFIELRRERQDLLLRLWKIYIQRESSNGQKFLEQVFKSKPNKESGSEILVKDNGVSAGTPNKPKQSIVIVFAVKKKQAGTLNISRKSNGKLTGGETNGETRKQEIGVQPIPVPHQAVMGTIRNA